MEGTRWKTVEKITKQTQIKMDRYNRKKPDGNTEERNSSAGQGRIKTCARCGNEPQWPLKNQKIRISVI